MRLAAEAEMRTSITCDQSASCLPVGLPRRPLVRCCRASSERRTRVIDSSASSGTARHRAAASRSSVGASAGSVSTGMSTPKRRQSRTAITNGRVETRTAASTGPARHAAAYSSCEIDALSHPLQFHYEEPSSSATPAQTPHSVSASAAQWPDLNSRTKESGQQNTAPGVNLTLPPGLTRACVRADILCVRLDDVTDSRCCVHLVAGASWRLVG
eukprot:scaffold25447_cov90-Isochrysis_galbana.AAC.2